MRDPQIHSHIEDELPTDHEKAFACVLCSSCGEMLHASNNECMQTWVETGKGDFCIPCFSKIADVQSLDDEYGLKKDEPITGFPVHENTALSMEALNCKTVRSHAYNTGIGNRVLWSATDDE